MLTAAVHMVTQEDISKFTFHHFTSGHIYVQIYTDFKKRDETCTEF